MIDGPTHLIASKVTELAQPYTVQRASGSANTTYGSDRSDQYSVLGERDLYLYRQSTRSDQTAVGEVDDYRLEGYCLPTVDIEDEDRIEFDGDVYELDEPTPLPEHDPTVLSLEAQLVSE